MIPTKNVRKRRVSYNWGQGNSKQRAFIAEDNDCEGRCILNRKSKGVCRIMECNVVCNVS